MAGLRRRSALLADARCRAYSFGRCAEAGEGSRCRLADLVVTPPGGSLHSRRTEEPHASLPHNGDEPAQEPAHMIAFVAFPARDYREKGNPNNRHAIRRRATEPRERATARGRLWRSVRTDIHGYPRIATSISGGDPHRYGSISADGSDRAACGVSAQARDDPRLSGGLASPERRTWPRLSGGPGLA
jgi:hypothetical protein